MPTMNTLTDGTQRTEYSTKETAQAIRAALKKAFPGVKFSVRTSYASMTSSTDIRWTDGPTQPEVERVTGNFTSRGFDGMTDCTTYHSQIVDGRKVQYSGWVSCQRETSAALLERAIARYNVERADYGYGPVALTVRTQNGYSSLQGADASTANPCGGRATWCTDAVYQIAYNMRPNGLIVKLKDRF
jgi:hypothetical protein